MQTVLFFKKAEITRCSHLVNVQKMENCIAKMKTKVPIMWCNVNKKKNAFQKLKFELQLQDVISKLQKIALQNLQIKLLSMYH